MAVSDTNFLVECKRITGYIVKNKFTYGYKKAADTWAKAKKLKKVTCATTVSLILQQIGVLAGQQLIYATDKGNVGYIAHGKQKKSVVKKRIKKYFRIIKVKKKRKKVELLPGDIVFWKGHVSVFAGTNVKGKDVWYDGGRNATKDCKVGSRFVKLHKVRNMDNKKIYYILRFKKEYQTLK